MEPYDEERIGADDTIIRRINPEQHIVWDNNRACNRVSSKVFSPSSGLNGGMSVDIEKLIVAGGEIPQEYVTDPVFIGSVSFSAGAARNLSLRVGYDPLPDNPYHGEVWGSSSANRFSRSQKKGLGQVSTWYVEIQGVEIM